MYTCMYIEAAAAGRDRRLRGPDAGRQYIGAGATIKALWIFKKKCFRCGLRM